MTPTAPSTAPLMVASMPSGPAVFCSAGQLRTSCAGIALEAGATWPEAPRLCFCGGFDRGLRGFGGRCGGVGVWAIPVDATSKSRKRERRKSVLKGVLCELSTQIGRWGSLTRLQDLRSVLFRVHKTQATCRKFMRSASASRIRSGIAEGTIRRGRLCEQRPDGGAGCHRQPLRQGDEEIDLSGWSLNHENTGAKKGDWTFPDGTTLAPGEKLVLANSAAEYKARGKNPDLEIGVGDGIKDDDSVANVVSADGAGVIQGGDDEDGAFVLRD